MMAMAASADVFVRFAADHLWQSTVVLAGAAALCVALRRYAARVRYAICLLASAKFLLPFAGLTAIGSALPWPEAAIPDPPAVVTTVWTLGQPFVTRAADQAADARPATAEAPRSVAALPEVLMTVWLLGSVVVAARRVAEARRVLGIRRLARPIDRGREFDAFSRVGGGTVSGRVTLQASPHAAAPCVVGIVRPILLWPDGMSAALSDTQLDAIMRHELAHVGRRHNLGAVVHATVEVLFWFHPLVWWLGARLLAERERACDEDVLNAGASRSDYANAILRVCERSIGTPAVGAAGIASSTLTRRMEAIMSARTPQSLGWIPRAALVLLAVGLVAGPVVAGAMDPQATPTGSIAGAVTDEMGGVVPEVAVTVRATTSGLTRAAVTDASGRYRVADLPPGEYELRFVRPAFRPHVLRVNVGNGGTITADAEMRVGVVSESIRLIPSSDPAAPVESAETQLLQRLSDRPAEIQTHLALAELYYKEERFAESASAMARAAGLIAAEQAALALPSAPRAAATGDIDPPRKIRDMFPIYPAGARAAGVTGIVILEATIAEDGTVQDAHVRRSVPLLDESALGAVRQWLYTPTRLNGVPVSVTMTATISFGP